MNSGQQPSILLLRMKGVGMPAAKIMFVGTDEQGKRGGMISEIAENKPGEFVSIRHLGF